MLDGKLFGTALIGSLAVIATQTADAVTGLTDNQGLAAFIKEGGLTALLAVLIYFYRRDWARLNDTQREQNEQLVALITKSHEVEQQTALALAKQGDALDNLSDAVRDLKRPEHGW